MSSDLKSACDAVLHKVVSGSPRVPGVVAMATDRNGNIYEGAAGQRVLGQDAPMTTDSMAMRRMPTRSATMPPKAVPAIAGINVMKAMTPIQPALPVRS